MVLKKCLLFVGMFLLLMPSAEAQQVLIGVWKGSLKTPEGPLVLEVKFQNNGDLLGWLDIPQQSAIGLKLSEIRAADDSIHFEYVAGGTRLIFEGRYFNDSIAGVFTQAGYKTSFGLKRQPAERSNREMESFPYEEVAWLSGDIKLFGILSFPVGEAPFPVVLLISGSGGQNRTGEIFGFRMFDLLAEFFNQQGFAVLRYDDRGVGSSGGSLNEATTWDFANDAQKALDFLRSRPDIDLNSIGVLGHSEGAIIAAHLAARDTDLAFIIAMAGPALPGEEVLTSQAKRIAEVGKHTKEELDKALFQITHPDNSRWMKAFLRHNPADDWVRVQCPVLAFFGELDLQVDPRANSKALESCFKQVDKTNYRILTIAQANHLFQEAKTGLPGEFGELDPKFVDGLLKMISDWLHEL